MAAFDIQTRHPGIFRVTDDVTAAHDITNNTPETLVAGVIVTVTAGRKHPTQHLADATLIQIRPGETKSIDPTGVTQAQGVGFLDSKEQYNSTIDNFIVA